MQLQQQHEASLKAALDKVNEEVARSARLQSEIEKGAPACLRHFCPRRHLKGPVRWQRRFIAPSWNSTAFLARR